MKNDGDSARKTHRRNTSASARHETHDLTKIEDWTWRPSKQPMQTPEYQKNAMSHGERYQEEETISSPASTTIRRQKHTLKRHILNRHATRVEAEMWTSMRR